MASLAIDKTKTRPQEELYIALLDLDFTWYPAQVEEVIQLWNDGLGNDEIAHKVGREGDEVGLLIMDLIRNGVIKKRPGGICGDV